MSPKGPPSIFRQQTGFSKSPKAPPFTTLRVLSLSYSADFRRSRLVSGSPPNSDLQQNNNLEDLGAGSMGVCGNEYRAVLFHSENQKSSVRLRSCDESNLNDLKLFAIEAATMSQFYHPNVLMIHGVVYEGPRVFMCVEDNPLSSLDLYLKAAFASTPDSGG